MVVYHVPKIPSIEVRMPLPSQLLWAISSPAATPPVGREAALDHLNRQQHGRICHKIGMMVNPFLLWMTSTSLICFLSEPSTVLGSLKVIEWRRLMCLFTLEKHLLAVSVRVCNKSIKKVLQKLKEKAFTSIWGRKIIEGVYSI